MAKEVRIDLAPDIESIATSLIREFHPELTEAVVLYCITSAPAKCSPEKCNPRVRFFASREVKGVVKAEVAAGPDFIVWVNEEIWKWIIERGKQRPFVDHLVEHMGRELDGEQVPRYFIKPHEFEEFPAVLQRFGAWSDEAKQVRDILQAELDLGLEPAGTSVLKRKSSIDAITLSTPGSEPVTLTPEQWDRVVRTRTGE